MYKTKINALFCGKNFTPGRLHPAAKLFSANFHLKIFHVARPLTENNLCSQSQSAESVLLGKIGWKVNVKHVSN